MCHMSVFYLFKINSFVFMHFAPMGIICKESRLELMTYDLIMQQSFQKEKLGKENPEYTISFEKKKKWE